MKYFLNKHKGCEQNPDDNHMGKEERRKYPRVEIYTPISYLCEDSKGDIKEQNIGVVRNVSQSGIQIETVQEIQSEFVTLIFLGSDRNQIETKGKVVYCRRGNSGQFNIGIKFQETAERNIWLIRALVRSYHYSKDKSQLKISPMIQM
jgi:c-di-GMP-binding flagellar brake protein YcgR